MYTGKTFYDTSGNTEYTKVRGGSPYMVLNGPSALKPEIKESMYSNNIFNSRGDFRLEVVDTVDENSEFSGDRAYNVAVIFKSPEGDKYYFQSIVVDREASMSETRFGGVGLNKYIYGDTGIGTDLYPKTLAYIVLWGRTNLYKNGHLMAKDAPVHVAVIQGAMDPVTGKMNPTVDPDVIEAHVVIPNLEGAEKYISAELEEGFLHVYYKDPGMFKSGR